MKEPTPRRSSRPDHSKLHALLIKACPPNKDGSAGSISTTLAPAMNVSFQSVYQWIRRDQLPPKQARALVAASSGRITIDEVMEFVI